MAPIRRPDAGNTYSEAILGKSSKKVYCSYVQRKMEQLKQKQMLWLILLMKDKLSKMSILE